MKRLLVSAISLAFLAGAVVLAQDPNTQSAAKLDLNKATVAELQTLPGVGSRTAERIVEFREKNGPFKRIEDLMNVSGIGEKKFLKLKDRITVSGG